MRTYRDAVDGVAGTREDLDSRRAFRFRSLPGAMHGQPSVKLPRDVPRPHEILLFRARIGMLTSAGGNMHDSEDHCPLCYARVLGRDGATLTHIIDCLRSYTRPAVVLTIQSLWEEPVEAARTLAHIDAIVRASSVGQERQQAAAAQRQRRRRS